MIQLRAKNPLEIDTPTQRSKEGFSPTGFRGSMALPTLDFGPLTSKAANFCCFRPPGLWFFVMAAPVTNMSGLYLAETSTLILSR